MLLADSSMDKKIFLKIFSAVFLLTGFVAGQCDVRNLCYDCQGSDDDIYIGHVCDGEDDCANGDDEADCDNTITCDSGEEIVSTSMCNGLLDCTSKEDEESCSHCDTFSDDFHECSGLCLLKSEYVCDGYTHCDDGSDESDCDCDENHQFECSSGVCILDDLVCDGEEDCADGSDEASCGLSCTGEEFECLDYNSCVDLTLRCDGNDDCQDGSDEWYCVSLDDTTSAILVLHQGVNSPVCAIDWNSDWNDITCKEMGLGTSSENGSVSLGDLSSYTINGFFLPQDKDNPSSLMELFGHGDSCDGEAVTLTCNDDACGSRGEPNMFKRRKLLQGDDAVIGDFPWQVGIVHDGSHSCGGSLISANWVLTAAHCVDTDSDPANYDIRMGTIDSYGTSGTLQTANVEAIHIHEDYNNETLINDIALLKLSASVVVNDVVRPICLPAEGESFPTDEYVECFTSGWGGINREATLYPTTLQQLKMNLVSDSVCAADSNIQDTDIFVSAPMICAGYADNFATICSGDSGGPLVCRSRRTNTWTQAGVVSWGPTNGSISCMSYGVYAETEYFKSWIDGFETGATYTSLSETQDDDDDEDDESGAMKIADFYTQLMFAIVCVFFLL